MLHGEEGQCEVGVGEVNCVHVEGGQCVAGNSLNYRGLHVYKVFLNCWSIFCWFINSSHQKSLQVYMVYISCVHYLSINQTKR